MGEYESAIERRVTRWAEARGVWVWKLNVMGRRGLPDRVYIMPPGSAVPVVFIEFKREGKKARALQVYTHEKLRERGVPCLSTDNDRAAITFLERYLPELEPT